MVEHDCLEISLLGGVVIKQGGSPVTGLASRKAEALLAYLACNPRPHPREILATFLWDDRSQKQALSNLRVLISSLRQHLNPFIDITRQTIAIIPHGDIWLDVNELEDHLSAASAQKGLDGKLTSATAAQLEKAIALYQGDFMAGFFLRESQGFDEWAALERERLRRRVIQAFQELIHYCLHTRDYTTGIKYAARLINMEPLHETAYRQMMLLLARSGQRNAAMTQYEAYRQLLADELGVEPTQETTALYRRIQEVKTTQANNLPLQLTSFVGRGNELADISERFDDPTCRLLTLVGPGGVGKTRLAIKFAHLAARERAEEFPHGIYFVPLSNLESPDLIAPTIAETIGFSFYQKEEPENQILNYLRQREMLLVLDNLEQHVNIENNTAIRLLVDFLQYAPGVRLLATSRHPLNLRAEWLLEIEGLEYPAEGITSSPETCSAMQLFDHIARRVKPRFSLSAEWSHVARICQLVEGMPLAIELAAAWLQVWECAEIPSQIEHDLDFLATSMQDVPERHRNIRAVFEHSWGMLSEEEKRIFRKLSIFSGGFDKAAARQVVEASQRQLANLVNRSMLRLASPEYFSMHRLIQQFAQEKLTEAPQERDASAHQHSDFYLAYLGKRASALKGNELQEALGEISKELDNIRAAWHWAVANKRIDLIEEAMEALYLFYTTRSWYDEGERMFAEAAGMLEEAREIKQDRHIEIILGKLLARQGKLCEFTVSSTKAQNIYERCIKILKSCDARQEMALPLHGLGFIAHMQGNYTTAREYFQESITIYREAGDPGGQAAGLNNLSQVAQRQGNFVEAQEFCLEGLEIRREIDDRRGIASSLNNLGLIQCKLGDFASAMQALQESIEICQELEYRVGIANASANLSHAAYRLGQREDSRRFSEQSLEVYREIGDLWGVAIALNNLGYIAFEMGEYQEAKARYRESVTIYKDIDVKSGLANTLCNLGFACHELGEDQEAQHSFQASLQTAAQIGDIPTAMEALTGIATIHLQEGRTARSLEILAVAVNHPAAQSLFKDRVDHLLDELEKALPPEEISSALEKGKSIQVEKFIDEVLTELEAT